MREEASCDPRRRVLSAAYDSQALPWREDEHPGGFRRQLPPRTNRGDVHSPAQSRQDRWG